MNESGPSGGTEEPTTDVKRASRISVGLGNADCATNRIADDTHAQVGSPLPRGIGGQRLIRDLPCISCGYNLRRLAPVGACPECATAIDRSLDANRLVFADHPRPLDSMVRGLTVLVWSVPIAIALYLAAGQLGKALPTNWESLTVRGGVARYATNAGYDALVWVRLSATAAVCTGAFIASLRAPDRILPGWATIARRLTLALALIGAVVAVSPLFFVGTDGVDVLMRPQAPFRPLLLIGQILLGIVIFPLSVYLGAVMQHMRRRALGYTFSTFALAFALIVAAPALLELFSDSSASWTRSVALFVRSQRAIVMLAFMTCVLGLYVVAVLQHRTLKHTRVSRHPREALLKAHSI